MPREEDKLPDPRDDGVGKAEARPEDDLAKLERLLQGEELGRFHPELGDVYDQLDQATQQRLDSIIKTSLSYRKALLSTKA